MDWIWFIYLWLFTYLLLLSVGSNNNQNNAGEGTAREKNIAHMNYLGTQLTLKLKKLKLENFLAKHS